MRCAIRSFHSTSRAWPSSSISRQITAAPYSRARVKHAIEPRARRFAVLEVGRVEDRATAEPLQAGLHHLRLGRVEDQRAVGLRGESLGDLVHVERAVAAHVVDAHVEHVGTFAALVLGHLHAGVPVGLRAWPRGTLFDPLAFVRSPMIRNDVS